MFATLTFSKLEQIIRTHRISSLITPFIIHSKYHKSTAIYKNGPFTTFPSIIDETETKSKTCLTCYTKSEPAVTTCPTCESSIDPSFVPDCRFTVLGSVSQCSTKNRGVSSYALILPKETWLFDCGEGTQKQIEVSPSVRSGKIKKIFITHMHGDHVFGLPPLLYGLSHSKSAGHRTQDVIVYGPRGIKSFLENNFRLTNSGQRNRLPGIKVFEFAPKQEQKGSGLTWLTDGSVEIDTGSRWKVVATRITHSIPCWGYVISESPKPPGLDWDKLQEEYPFISLGSWIRDFTNLNPDEYFELPFENKPKVQRKNYLKKTSPTRKLVILGDTSNPSNLADIAKDADLLLHEATISFLSSESVHIIGAVWLVQYSNFFQQKTKKTKVPGHLVQRAVARGHSTSMMAAKFANKIRAKNLILTHFGRGEAQKTNTVVQDALDQANQVVENTKVFAAEDFGTMDL